MSWRDVRTRAPIPSFIARGIWLIPAILAALLAAPPAQAASGDVDLSAYVANGPVNAVVHAPDGSTYIGGDFSEVGPRIGSGMALEPSSSGIQLTSLPGEPDPTTFPEVAGGSVYAVAPDGSGGWYIGGNFSYVGAQQHLGLAHIKSDGTVDSSWNPSATGGSSFEVEALAVSSGTVYVGGDFTTIDGQARNRIAAIDSSGNATSWNPNADGSVRALAVSGAGSTVYAGGEFGSIGGQSRSHIAALSSSDGTATSWDPSSDSDVDALAISPDGNTVYAGGSFSSIGGQSRNSIAALDASSGTATSWSPNADGSVYALALSADGNTVYAGGSFSTIDGTSRNRIAALDAGTGNATSWNPGANGIVGALAASGSTVYAGGDFTDIGGQTRNHLAALDADGVGNGTGDARTWDPNPDATVHALTASDTAVYAGGDFVTAGPNAVARSNIARLNADGTVDTAWNPGADDVVNALALSANAGTLYVGGAFTTLGGQSQDGLGALNASEGSVISGWAPSVAGGEVDALAVSPSDGTVYVGGGFLSLGSVGPYIGAVDSAGNVNGSWDPSPDQGAIDALAVSPDGDTVYVGGGFGQIGGQTRANIAALDAVGVGTGTGEATTWDPGSSLAAPDALTASSGLVYAGGQFSTIGGSSRNGIAALDSSTGDATSWDPDAGSGTVRALAVSPDGSTVYAGGQFAGPDSIGGADRNHIAAIDATTGQASAWNPNADGSVNALALSADGNTVYAGGDFTSVGGNATAHFAQIDATQIGFSASPPSKAFGSQPVGGSSAPQTFTVTNTGIDGLLISNVSLVGADNDQFSILSDQCTGTVPAGNTCIVQVAFDPTNAGTKSASLEFADNGSGSTQDVALTGTGTSGGPGASLTPPSYSYGSWQVGMGSSTSQLFTLTNTGGADLVVSTVSLTGADAGQFAASADSCTGVTVTAGTSCTVAIAFAPTSAGAKGAQLSIADNDAGSPQVADLSGTATSPISPPPAAPVRSPDTTISQGPPKVTPKRKATFQFTSDQAGSHFECKLDTGAFLSCQSPMTLGGLKPGPHIFDVRAVNGASTDGSPATYSWKVKAKKKKRKKR